MLSIYHFIGATEINLVCKCHAAFQENGSLPLLCKMPWN